jgi:hypothetical protein
MQHKPFLIFGIIFLLLAPLALSGVSYTYPYPKPKVETGNILMNYVFPLIFFVHAFFYWKLNDRSIRMSRGFHLSHLIISVILFEYITHLPVLILKFLPGAGPGFIETLTFAIALNIVFNGLYLLILFLALLLRRSDPQTI